MTKITRGTFVEIRFGFLTLLMVALQTSAAAADCDNIGRRLNELASADQQIRQEGELQLQNAQATSADRDGLQARWKVVDGENLKQFKEIIASCGWPKTAKDSHSAWLLAQHADSDLPFQREARGHLTGAVKAGIGAPRDLAYLSDRIAANEGRPQEYGTQFSMTDRCQLTLEPVDDLAMVDRRRLAIGLQSLKDYEAEGRRRFIPADCPAEKPTAKSS